jgi:Flp pilus assembly protein TadD
MKAACLARSGYADEAARTLQTTSELHPEIRGLPRAIGTLLLKAERPEAASDAFREAAREDPQDVEAANNCGAALVVGGRTREAVKVLREALKGDPRRPETLNNLGVAHLRLGHRKSAAADIKGAARNLETPRILLNLAEIQESGDEGADALGTVDQVLRMQPEDSEALAARKRLARTPRSRNGVPKKTPVRRRKAKPPETPKPSAP